MRGDRRDHSPRDRLRCSPDPGLHNGHYIVVPWEPHAFGALSAVYRGSIACRRLLDIRCRTCHRRLSRRRGAASPQRPVHVRGRAGKDRAPRTADAVVRPRDDSGRVPADLRTAGRESLVGAVPARITAGIRLGGARVVRRGGRHSRTRRERSRTRQPGADLHFALLSVRSGRCARQFRVPGRQPSPKAAPRVFRPRRRHDCGDRAVSEFRHHGDSRVVGTLAWIVLRGRLRQRDRRCGHQQSRMGGIGAAARSTVFR